VASAGGTPFVGLFEADGRTPLDASAEPLQRALREGLLQGVEISVGPPAGAKRLLRVSGQALAGGGGAVVTLRDISEERRREHTLRYLADHDPLTGLPNRNVLIRALSEALGDPDRGVLAVLFIDLDGFKAVNDGHGHEVGDRVLTALAQRIRASVKENDVASRLGGDEFAVFSADLSAPAAAAAIAERIERTIAEPVMVGAELFEVGASIGVVTAQPGDEVTAEDLVRRADQAMYLHKRRLR
jgi:diguanylate cyclase (GGDEF)-like protein